VFELYLPQLKFKKQ